MSRHHTAALDADQEERSADVVTGGRDEPAELVLGLLETRMAESGLPAHIYVTKHSATRRKRTERPLGRNVGPAGGDAVEHGGPPGHRDHGPPGSVRGA